MPEEIEPEVEMAEETEAEETESEVVEEVQPEPEPEVAEEPEPEPAPKPKRTPRRKPKQGVVAPEPKPEPETEPEPVVEEAPVEPPVEGEAPAEEEGPVELEKDEDQEDTPAEGWPAVMSRLDALEELLKGSKDDPEDGTYRERAEASERKLMAFKYGIRYGLPEELAERLHGVDEASFEEDAKKLATLLNAGSGGLGKGGMDPNEKAFDAKAVAQAYRRSNGAR